MSVQPPRLLDQVRAALRRKHYSIRTEEAYVSWIMRYIRFHQTRHPRELGAPEIEAFLTQCPRQRRLTPNPGQKTARHLPPRYSALH